MGRPAFLHTSVRWVYPRTSENRSVQLDRMLDAQICSAGPRVLPPLPGESVFFEDSAEFAADGAVAGLSVVPAGVADLTMVSTSRTTSPTMMGVPSGLYWSTIWVSAPTCGSSRRSAASSRAP